MCVSDAGMKSKSAPWFVERHAAGRLSKIMQHFLLLLSLAALNRLLVFM